MAYKRNLCSVQPPGTTDHVKDAIEIDAVGLDTQISIECAFIGGLLKEWFAFKRNNRCDVSKW